MPKDNENIPFPGPVEPSEPQGFSAEQMIRCEECLRANPPTRVTCLYCLAPLPLTEDSLRLRKPVLQPPAKHQLGYNNILLPHPNAVSAQTISDAAALLKLAAGSFEEILSQRMPLPVARTASREEAELVSGRLRDFGFDVVTLSDGDFCVSNSVRCVRSMSFDDESLTIHQAGAFDEVSWSDVVLIVLGRLFETRFEITERKSRKPENEILDTSEFFKDEAVVDFYTARHSLTWRVSANGFDFSCLGKEKTLIANENIGRLQQLLIAKAVNARVDDSYRQVRGLLELVWSTQPETQSSGWRREGPGKLSVGMATIKRNENQFTLYSRLLYHTHLNYGEMNST